MALVDGPGYRRFDNLFLLGVAQVCQHHPYSEQTGKGVGGPLASEVWRRAMNGLEHCHPSGIKAVDIGAGRHPQAPLERCP